MADRVDVTFKMTAADLKFLMWAMEFLEGGPHDYEKEIKEWAYQFRRALDDHFEEVGEGEEAAG